MSQAVDMAKISVRGGFHVMWGLVASTVISAVGTIIIGILLGPDNYGLYAIALTAPNLIVLFRDWGVTSAMIRYTAHHNAENRPHSIRCIFISGLVFELVLGALLALVGFLLSDFLAGTLFNRPEITTLLQVSSLTILGSALVTTATSAFTGIETMHLNSVMLVAQSLMKTGLLVALVLLGFGTYGAVTGFTLGTLFAGLVGVGLMFTIYRRLARPDGSKLEIGHNIRVMLKYGLPLSVGTILAGVLIQYYNFLLYMYIPDNALIGNLSIAQNFVVLITFFAAPVTTMVFPAFSKLDYRKDPETLQSVFQASVKYASLLVVPVAAMIMALAQPAIGTLFGKAYGEAPLFLALLSIAYLYTIFGNLSNGSLINGQGQTTFNMIVALITAGMGFPLGFVLISSYGVMGLVVTTLATSVPGIIVSLAFIRHRYHVAVNWRSSAKILLSSSVAAVVTYVLVGQIGAFSSLAHLIIGVVVFVPTYLLTAILTRTINDSDIANLRGILTALGPLNAIFDAILSVIEKLMVFCTPKQKPSKP